MLEFVALEVLLAAIAGPCFACWTLGEMRGARRVRQLIRVHNLDTQPDDLLEPLPRVNQGRVDRGSALMARSPRRSIAQARNVAKRPHNRRKSDRLSELHAIPEPSPEYLEAMRERHEKRLRELDLQVSADAMSPEVIQRYQGSLAALARANAARIHEQAIILPDPHQQSSHISASVEEATRKTVGSGRAA